MPVTKLNPLGVAGPRVIVPISSLSPGLDEVATTAVTPDIAVALPAPGVIRPLFADYQVTAQGGAMVGDQYDLSRLLAVATEQHPTAAVFTVTAPVRAEIDAASSSPAPAIHVADVLTVAAAAPAPMIQDRAAVADLHDESSFAAIAPAAFRMPDAVTLDWHHPCAMPVLATAPIDGMELLLG